MTRLHWGIIGPGRIAPRIARALAGHSRGELQAVASRDLERARTFAAAHGAAVAYGSYEALLADPSIDVVYVALPNHLHAEWSVRALEAGKHVLCEKPLALTVAEVDEIAAAAPGTDGSRSRRSCTSTIRRRWRPSTSSPRGVLGPIQLIGGSFAFFLTAADDPRIDPGMGGGSLWDVGCYPVSVARRIAGREPEAIGAFARFDDRGVDRTFVGQLRFPGGLLAQFDSGFAAPDRERVEIVGSDATLVLEHPFLPAPDGPLPASPVAGVTTPSRSRRSIRSGRRSRI